MAKGSQPKIYREGMDLILKNTLFLTNNRVLSWTGVVVILWLHWYLEKVHQMTLIPSLPLVSTVYVTT